MRKRFKNFIEEHNLVPPRSKFIIAVSGGVDSMVMLHLFHTCGYNFAVAHCNFNLRGSESDADEQLVVNTCNNLGIEVFVKHFDTSGYAHQKSLSIQVAARELRYNWFSELCTEKGFGFVAVAHNKNDIAETVILNLTRGAGVKGLTGIKPKINGVIRPLLFALRTEIDSYANQHNVLYRNDSSNAQTKYARNRIRHLVLPELAKINEGVIDNIFSTTQILQCTWNAIYDINKEFKRDVCTEVDGEVHYNIELLKSFAFRQSFLFEELVDFGFTPSDILDIEKSLTSQPGRVFYSPTYQLVRDRQSLILISLCQSTNYNETQIFEGVSEIESPVSLRLSIELKSINTVIPKMPEIAILNYDKLKFPLTVRVWKEGDWFIPFGMKGRKKISDFLIDNKIPLHQKTKVFVLESEGEIIWVIGHRIDNRYRIDSNCEKIFRIEFSRPL